MPQQVVVAEPPLRHRNRIILAADFAVIVEHGDALCVMVSGVVGFGCEPHVVLAKAIGAQAWIQLRRLVPESKLALARQQVGGANAPEILNTVRDRHGGNTPILHSWR